MIEFAGLMCRWVYLGVKVQRWVVPRERRFERLCKGCMSGPWVVCVSRCIQRVCYETVMIRGGRGDV